jgi:two-component system sensor histidine kinase DesK
MRLLPKNREHGWVPYVWLCFLAFYVFDPAFAHADWKLWTFTAVTGLVFLVLYFATYWIRPPWNRLCVGGMWLLGVGCAPYNPSASIFFIYASSLVPFVTDRPRDAALGLAGILATVSLEAWLLHLPTVFWAVSYIVCIPVGTGNIFFAQKIRDNRKLRLAHDEIENLAKIAERERIARDLHDVLGHTLSVVVLKSELAARLIERDPVQARKEINDVEQTARQALADVRQAIGGYRSLGLNEEFTRAKATLQTAGVAVECETSAVGLAPAQESVLALALREAVTNVVRHSRAHNCRLRLQQTNGSCHLEVHDDGRGGAQAEGNGLRGMRERIEAFGGTLLRETGHGTKLSITLPVAFAQEAGRS